MAETASSTSTSSLESSPRLQFQSRLRNEKLTCLTREVVVPHDYNEESAPFPLLLATDQASLES